MNWRKIKLRCDSRRSNAAPYKAQTRISVVAVFAILLVVYPLSYGETLEDHATPLSKEQVAELLGSERASALTWKKLVGTDSTVYYGRNKERPSEVVGIYLGGYPPFVDDVSLPKKRGRLGMYEITWQRRDDPNHPGLVRWETVTSLHSDYWKAYVWIAAADSTRVDQLAEEVSQFPMFKQMPRPVGAP
jgi:hypothetical protein